MNIFCSILNVKSLGESHIGNSIQTNSPDLFRTHDYDDISLKCRRGYGDMVQLHSMDFGENALPIVLNFIPTNTAAFFFFFTETVLLSPIVKPNFLL